MDIQGVKIEKSDDISTEEATIYVNDLLKKYKAKYIDLIELKSDGEYIDAAIHVNTGFDRIRRITGYLVGTVDRFNDAKRQEVEDRVKHSL